MRRRKIILDCDPGHDDAVAIMLAGRAPELEILGITVVSGNQTIEKTSQNALNVLQYLELDIPVYAGCGQPMVRKRIHAADIHGSSGLDGPVFPELKRTVEKEHAVTFIIRSLLSSEEAVTMVTTGPMTNLAMAMRMNPGILDKIERIVLMGGSYGNGNITPAAEFNIAADAEAAYVCFNSGRPITMAGLDVTRKALCFPEIVERMGRIDNKASKLFVDLMGHFCRTQKEVFGWEGGPLHDPVPVAYLIDPDILKTKAMNVEIDIRSEQSYGRTNCDYFGYLQREATADVAVDIQVECFWDCIESGLRRYG